MRLTLRRIAILGPTEWVSEVWERAVSVLSGTARDHHDCSSTSSIGRPFRIWDGIRVGQAISWHGGWWEHVNLLRIITEIFYIFIHVCRYILVHTHVCITSRSLLFYIKTTGISRPSMTVLLVLKRSSMRMKRHGCGHNANRCAQDESNARPTPPPPHHWPVQSTIKFNLLNKYVFVCTSTRRISLSYNFNWKSLHLHRDTITINSHVQWVTLITLNLTSSVCMRMPFFVNYIVIVIMFAMASIGLYSAFYLAAYCH